MRSRPNHLNFPSMMLEKILSLSLELNKNLKETLTFYFGRDLSAPINVAKVC